MSSIETRASDYPHITPNSGNPNWWQDPTLTTWSHKLEAGILNHSSVSSSNQLAQLSARLGYGRDGRGIDRSVFSYLIAGRRKEPQEHTLKFLSEVLGGTLRWWRQSAPSHERISTWKPPAEANSPFGTQRVRHSFSDLMRGIHEQSANAYVTGQTDLVEKLIEAGVGGEELRDYVADVNDVSRMPSSTMMYDPSLDDAPAAV